MKKQDRNLFLVKFINRRSFKNRHSKPVFTYKPLKDRRKEKMDVTNYIDKKIKLIIAENGRTFCYTGIILSEDTDSINFRDRFDKEFLFAKSTITKIEVL